MSIRSNYVSDDPRYFTQLLDLYKDDSGKKVALNNFWRRICFNREAMDHLFSMAIEGTDVGTYQNYPRHSALRIS